MNVTEITKSIKSLNEKQLRVDFRAWKKAISRRNINKVNREIDRVVDQITRGVN